MVFFEKTTRNTRILEKFEQKTDLMQPCQFQKWPFGQNFGDLTNCRGQIRHSPYSTQHFDGIKLKK